MFSRQSTTVERERAQQSQANQGDLGSKKSEFIIVWAHLLHRS